MRYPALIIFLTLIIGCTSVEIQQNRPITPGQIFVEKFTGTTGEIVTNVIQIEFQKRGLLATRDQAKYILTGNSTWDVLGSTTIVFHLVDKKNNLYFRGNLDTIFIPRVAAKDVAKKISKKLKKTIDRNQPCRYKK